MLNELDWTRATISGAASINYIMEGILGVVMGGLNDRVGPRVVLTICGACFGIGILMMSQIGTIWHLYLFYGVMAGIGVSGIMVPLSSTIARWFFARRNLMTGIVMTGSGTGGLVGPLFANCLVSRYDWRTSYIILGGLVLLFIVTAAQFLKRAPAQKDQPPYGLAQEAKRDHARSHEGLVLKEAAITNQFWLIFFLFFCFGLVYITILVHIVAHATDLGISAAMGAGILAVTTGASAIGNVVMGGVGDRIGDRKVFVVGFIAVIVCLLWLLWAKDVWALLLFGLLYGFACGGCVSSQPPIIARFFGLRSHGLLLGIAGFGHTAGGGLGSFLAGYYYDLCGSYQLTFLFCAAMGCMGFILTMLLKPVRKGF
jgi:MFS family permease